MQSLPLPAASIVSRVRLAVVIHPAAYTETGVSELPLSDLPDIAFAPDGSEWGSIDTWNQGLETGVIVGGEWVDSVFGDGPTAPGEP